MISDVDREQFKKATAEVILYRYASLYLQHKYDSPAWSNDPTVAQILEHINLAIDYNDLLKTVRTISEPQLSALLARGRYAVWLVLDDVGYMAGSIHLHTNTGFDVVIKNFNAADTPDKVYFKNYAFAKWLFQESHEGVVIDTTKKLQELDYRKTGKALINEIIPKNEKLQKLFFPHYGNGFIEFRRGFTNEQLKKRGLNVEAVQEMVKKNA